MNNQASFIGRVLETKPTLNQINGINIALMLVSLGIAIVVPFELFLLAYAVLGPLHYLTEISWLHDKDYFIPQKKDALFFVLLGLVLLYGLLFPMANVLAITALVLCLGVVFAFSLLFTNNIWVKSLAIAVPVVLFYFGNLSQNYAFFLVFAVFVPTLVHVFLFTGLFVLYGNMKSNNTLGWWSLGVYVACCAVPWFISSWQIPVFTTHYSFIHYKIYTVLNQSLAYIFGWGRFASYSAIIHSDKGIMLMRFIAFVYTYHYFNWFSKTSIIQWHQASRLKLGLVFGLWFLSVGLYVYDYTLGFMCLYFLSMLHVFLEFPLNFKTILGIFSNK